MADIMKHVGVYGEKPCVVIFREVPNEPENCLVVQTGNLSDQHHDSLMMVVQSAEGQGARDISEVLSRRQFPDGESMLNSLHFGKKLQKVPVSMVSLTPTPSQKIALSEVNAEIRKIDNGNVYNLKTDEGQEQFNKPLETDPNLVQPVENTTDNGTDPESVAQNILVQAELMEQDAQTMLAEAEAKRQEAYNIDPSLKPKRGPGRPPKNATA